MVESVRVYYLKDDPVAKIELTSGENAGVVYSYGSVSFDEDNEGMLKFEYDIFVGTPVNINTFERSIGDILVDMIGQMAKEGSIVFKGGVDES